MSAKCRVCLVENVRMHCILKTPFIKIYEKLLDIKFNMDDGKPKSICFICNAILQKFWKLFNVSQRSDKLLTMQLLDGIEVWQGALEDGMRIHKLTTTAIHTTSFIDNGEYREPEVTVTIKEEPLEFEELEEFIEYLDSPPPQEKMLEEFKEEYLDSPASSVKKLEEFKEEYLESPPPEEITEKFKEEYLDPPSPEEMFHDFDQERTIANTPLLDSHRTKVLEDIPADFIRPASWTYSSDVDFLNMIPKENSENKEYDANKFLKNLKVKLERFDNDNDSLYCPENATNKILRHKYSCRLCNYRCKKAKALTSHQSVHSQINTFSCEFCSYRFATREKLARHRNSCTVCIICGKQFSNLRGLKIHIRLHTGEQPYSCKLCGRGFNQETNLRTHMRVHARDKQYPCTICDVTFPFRSYLDRHMLVHGENQLDVDSFNRIKNCHRLFNHKKKKLCICNICGKVLHKGSLSMHMRLHTGGEPYKCERCDRVFNQKCNLLTHIERLHALDELFCCKTCYKVFALNSDLKQHLMSHIGELSSREYELFFQKHVSMVHERLHTGQVTPYACDLCDSNVIK